MDDGGRLFLNDRRLFAYLQLVDEKQNWQLWRRMVLNHSRLIYV